MKIDANNAQPLKVRRQDVQSGAPEKAAQAPQAAEPEALVASDKVNLSNRSKLIAKARELASSAPDVRAEKVADLTARIAANNYKVSSETVANSIIKKSFSGLF
jgi:negative regulator of flagellin synthesis FlgM